MNNWGTYGGYIADPKLAAEVKKYKAERKAFAKARAKRKKKK